MSHGHKLSLTQAILVNINVMMGAGIFMNTSKIAQKTGALGGLSYLLIGIMMLPLVLSLAKLLEIHPSGNFYTFASKEIHPFAGFLSAWCYFIGKLGSAALMMHTAVLLLMQLVPSLQAINPVAIDLTILSAFIGLNMFNIKTGSTIQSFFLGFKLIPIFFAIIAGLFLFDGAHFSSAHLIWEHIPSSLPMLLYATLGFETACSISSKIHDSHINGPRVIMISYGLVILMACSYQLIFYGALGSLLANAIDFRAAFPALTAALLPENLELSHMISSIIHIAIASSALGGSYGIIFSNNWNLYGLAQNSHTFASKYLIQLNKHEIPWLCVIIEGVICASYLLTTLGQQVPLQLVTVLGSIIAYSFSVASLLMAKRANPLITGSWIAPMLGVISCTILAGACINGLIVNGLQSLTLFAIMLSIGIGMFWHTNKTNSTTAI